VWGCENPEVLLTETMALHDWRVQDSKNDDGTNNDMKNSKGNPLGDPDPDQVRVPQGSLFLELYCPRRNMPLTSYPQELYNTFGQLILGAMVPPSLDGTYPAYPVWRVAITRSRVASAANDLRTRVSTNPDTTNLDPPLLPPATQDPNHWNAYDTLNPLGALQIERRAILTRPAIPFFTTRLH
jgi:hypothetical protein